METMIEVLIELQLGFVVGGALGLMLATAGELWSLTRVRG